MNSLTIKLVMSDIEAVSDRTARQLLKDIAKLCHRAQLRELDILMDYLQLNRRERQSIRDKITSEIQTEPKYYIKSIETGSIEIAVFISALAVWLLQATVGETFKEAWKQTKIHKGVIDWVSNNRKEELSEIVKEQARKHDFLSGRAYASTSDLNEDSNVIEINLQKSEYFEIEKNSKITEEEVIAQGRNYLSNLEDNRDD